MQRVRRNGGALRGGRSVPRAQTEKEITPKLRGRRLTAEQFRRSARRPLFYAYSRLTSFKKLPSRRPALRRGAQRLIIPIRSGV